MKRKRRAAKQVGLSPRNRDAGATNESVSHGTPSRAGAHNAHDQDAETASRVDSAYQQIIVSIVSGEWPGGTELKSTELAEAMGVSRTPVIGAISRLIAENIVTQELNMRAIVRSGSEKLLFHMHELRMMLEPFAAGRAAQRMPRDVIGDLSVQADNVAPQSDDGWLTRARDFDFKLHMAIADHAANQPLRWAISKCWQYKRLANEDRVDRVESTLRDHEEHLLILAAMRARDSETAAAAMDLHLRLAHFYRSQDQDG